MPSYLLILIPVLFYVWWYFYIRQTYQAGAPFVPMDPRIIERSLQLAQIKPGDIFYELGSGDGRVVIAAALKDAKVKGVEIDKLRVLYSRIWLWILRLETAEIINKSFFDIDLSDADIVFTYLLEETNEKLEEKLKKELRPGTRVVGVGFKFPNWKPVKVDPDGPIYGPIHLYKI